jgi:acyl-coenzyme A synthetase/AMP-(fatty) acid ligase
MLYLACVRAGAIFLPLNTAYTLAELDYFIGDAEPKLIVCDPAKRDGDCLHRRPSTDAVVETLDARGEGLAVRKGACGVGDVRQCRARAGRSRRHPLHVGHHGPLQGRDAATTISRRTR